MTLIQLIQVQINNGWFSHSVRSESDNIVIGLINQDRVVVEIQFSPTIVTGNEGMDYNFIRAEVKAKHRPTELLSFSELHQWFIRATDEPFSVHHPQPVTQHPHAESSCPF